MSYILFNKKSFCTIGFFITCYTIIYAQQLKHLDSLASKYLSGNYSEKDKLSILRELAEEYPDPDKQLSFSNALIQAAKRSDTIGYLYVGYVQKGTALRLKSNLSEALENYFKAAKIARPGIQTGAVDAVIADVYSITDNHNNAVNYYQKAITILKGVKDSAGIGVDIATALYNLGNEYLKVNKLDSALANTKEAQDTFAVYHSEMGLAYCLGNIGIIYSRLGKDKQAEENLNKAITILEPLEEYAAICEFLVSMSDIYHEKRIYSTAKKYVAESLALAKKYGLKEQASGADLKLSTLYQDEGDNDNALQYYKEYIVYRDSVKNIQAVEQMADLRTNFEVSKKQVQVDLLSQQKKNQQIIVIATIIALVLIALLAVGLYRRNVFVNKTNHIIDAERKRSDNLLLNILPEQTANELKQSGKVQPRKFESVTVLFTDFTGFTHYAEKLSPEQVVTTVDFYFSKFDEIIEKYGLEKIKTVGDCYMCAGGLPFPTSDHAFKTIQAALEIAEFVNDSKKPGTKGEISLDARVGINTGPVVAGVVGFKKFAYDIWGDTVNIASRMEANSQPGKINISENTYELIKDVFDCEYRGEIGVKNRGMMKMYFVLQARKESSNFDSTYSSASVSRPA